MDNPVNHAWAAWIGRPSEIAEVIEHDSRDDVSGGLVFSGVGGVLMVSVQRTLTRAKRLADLAGYDVVEGELVRRFGPADDTEKGAADQ